MMRSEESVTGAPEKLDKIVPKGFGGRPLHEGRKSIIAAVNGLAVGGGMETILGCDLVVVSP